MPILPTLGLERGVRCAALLGCCSPPPPPLLAGSGSLVAQDYPSRPIRWSSTYPTGNSSTCSSRILAQDLGARLASEFVIDNGDFFRPAWPGSGRALVRRPGRFRLHADARRHGELAFVVHSSRWAIGSSQPRTSRRRRW